MTHETYAGDSNSRTDSGIESSETETEIKTSGDHLLEEALELTNFQVSQLAVAVGNAKSGQQILRTLNDLPFDNEITHGRFYPNLDVLYEAGLIEKHERDRRTNEYPVTAQGKALLSAYGNWLENALAETDDRSTPISLDAKRFSFQLTHFQIGCLASLTGDRVSGQTAKGRLKEDLGQDINHGRLYPNLDTVVDNDCVEKGEIDRDRRTNGYELTDIGRGVLAARFRWLRDQGAVDGAGGDA
jgi:DNA-binding PadR family transcriptional regulator